MPVRKLKPDTPSRRYLSVSSIEELISLLSKKKEIQDKLIKLTPENAKDYN